MSNRVSLFVTCLVDQLFPKIGLAMADVLERIGYECEFRQDQTCCGQPAFNSGFTSEAEDVARHFLKTFEGAEYIVVPSGSCSAMIRHHFGDLFAKDDEARAAASEVGGRVYEFSEFLTSVAKVDDVGARYESVVTYHDSCHALRDLGIKSQPRRLLEKVRGIEIREMAPAEECCGFGGTFSVKMGELSSDMLDGKIQSIIASGARDVVSIDPSCLMQIEGGLRRRELPIRALHLAEVLAKT
ncbi:MAG: (Fe-S)-binding protein [Acidobacteria bacterium]|nr:(Fe-S)-binding protein [Acidobacteriota bacterium]